ncbi:flagellar assembly protein FliW [Entomospira entomophila]|uniref:Flagellar assembly factor FliW n=1 Tax=Entomospira entomophila TaxID=2719988 RepID=A0A968KTG6_9SPIO|nr:flagellar assembly protein FliW [Entomospira entomophilus]NIZ40291.1 flagellar assembly protein FliW [Entomospira entomophilus]WDI35850.1 flagellar assembly protein FliW [Entomospira entomophilus]
MKIQSKYYGSIDIDVDKQVYFFERGIPAFEHLKSWVLCESKQEPFFILQSLDDTESAFFLMNPWLCRSDYEVKLDDADLKDLGDSHIEMEHLLIFAILAIPLGKPQEMRINLQAPLVFDQKTRKASQVVLNDTRWQVQHTVAKELEREGKGRVIC